MLDPEVIKRIWGMTMRILQLEDENAALRRVNLKQARAIEKAWRRQVKASSWKRYRLIVDPLKSRLRSGIVESLRDPPTCTPDLIFTLRREHFAVLEHLQDRSPLP